MLDFAREEKEGGGGGGRGGGGRGPPAPPSKPASGAAALGGLVTGKPPRQVSGPQPCIPQISVSNPNGPRVDGNLGQIQIGKNTTLNANLTAPGGDPTVVVGVPGNYSLVRPSQTNQ
jgi:hypothetical protein